MVEHYLDIKRKHNFNSKDTMLQIVTTPLHNCQKFVSKRFLVNQCFDTKLSRKISKIKIGKMANFGLKMWNFEKITFEFDHFVRYISLNISSGSLLAFLFAPLVRFWCSSYSLYIKTLNFISWPWSWIWVVFSLIFFFSRDKKWVKKRYMEWL